MEEEKKENKNEKTSDEKCIDRKFHVRAIIFYHSE